jgi:hypothetical protein
VDRFDTIAATVTTKGGKRYRVSTVRRTIEHSGHITYESMVFPGDSYREVYSDRYATHTDARRGHSALVATWSD